MSDLIRTLRVRMPQKRKRTLLSTLRSHVRMFMWRLRRLVVGTKPPPILHGRSASVPDMLICIMDGNGRHAEKHNRPKAWGHLQGVYKAREIMKAAKARGIRKLGFWAASTDNFKRRSREEMLFLARLLKLEIRRFLKEPEEVRVRICGEWRQFIDDPELDQLIAEVEESTKIYTYLELTIFFGYGGELDVQHMVKATVRDFLENGRSVDDIDSIITPEYMHERLLSHWIRGDRILIVRTGEESRKLGHLSDFLMLQLRGIIVVFTTTLWPEYSVAELDEGLDEYGFLSHLMGAPRNALN